MVTKAMRVPMLQKWLGPGMLHHAKARLSIMADPECSDGVELKHCAETLAKKPLPKVMETLQQLEAIACFDSSVTPDGALKLARMVAELNGSEFADMYRAMLEKKLSRLATQPASLVPSTDLESRKVQARGADSLLADREHADGLLGQKVALAPVPVTYEPTVIRGAQDLIVTVDQSGIPRAYGKIDPQRLPERGQALLPCTMESIRRLYALNGQIMDYQVQAALDYAYNNVIKPICAANGEAETPTEWLARNVPAIPKAQWDSVFNENPSSKFGEVRLDETDILYELPQVIDQLGLTLQGLAREQAVDLPVVYVSDVRNLASDEALFPYPIRERNQMVTLYQQMLRPEVQAEIESRLGVSLSSMSARSQVQLLRFLCKQDRSAIERLSQNLKAKGSIASDMLNSFLAISESPSFGEAILTIGEKLPEKDAGLVFKKFNEITEQSTVLERLYAEHEKAGDVKGVRTATQLLIKKANETLLKFANKVNRGELEKEDASNLATQIEAINAEMIAYGAAVKSLATGSPVSVIDSPQNTYSVMPASAVDAVTREEMSKLVTHPRRQRNLAKCFEGDRDFHVLKRDEGGRKDMVAYFYSRPLQSEIREDAELAEVLHSRGIQTNDSWVYFGGFNADPSATGLTLGNNFRRGVIEQRFSNNPILLIVEAGNPNIDANKRLGFQPIGEPVTLSNHESARFQIMVRPIAN